MGSLLSPFLTYRQNKMSPGQDSNLFRKYGKMLMREEKSIANADRIRKELIHLNTEKEELLNLRNQKITNTEKSLNKNEDKVIKQKIKKLLQLNQGNHVFTCDACAKTGAKFSCITHKVFETHIKSTHQNYKPFKCNICPDTFRGQMLLANHIKKYHYKVLLNL